MTGSGRQRAERTGHPDEPVLVDRAHRRTEVGHGEGRPGRVLLDVERLRAGHPVAGLAEQVERVAEAADQPVADRGDGAERALGDVTGREGDPQVAAGHDVGRGRRDRGGRRARDERRLGHVGAVTLAVQHLGRDAGDRERRGQLVEALAGLRPGDTGPSGQQPRGAAADRDLLRQRAVERRLHLRERRDARDRRGTEREAVGDRTDEPAVRRVHRRPGHPLPDPADLLDGRGVQSRHHQVDPREHAVLEDAENGAGEVARRDPLADGLAGDRLRPPPRR